MTDVEVAVINKAEVEDMMRELLQQISVIRDKVDELEKRIGMNVSNSVEAEEEENSMEEEKSLEPESKPVAPAGEGGSKKKKEPMNVNENEPNPPANTGEVKADVDSIKGVIAEVVREEIRKQFEVVRTPMPDSDGMGVEPVADNSEEIRKAFRDILEGRANIDEVKGRLMRGE